MEKIYTKKGYTLVKDDGTRREITREVIVKGIADQTKLKVNVDKNLENLRADLEKIDAL